MNLEQLSELVKLGHSYEEAIEILSALGNVSSGGLGPYEAFFIGLGMGIFIVAMIIAWASHY